MKLTVTNVDKRMMGNGLAWFVTYSVQRDPGPPKFAHRISPDFDVFVHAFPEEKLLNTVAEYDLDPEDPDTLMDVVLSEPFLDDNDGEPTLFSGQPRGVIREAHLRRCAKAKLAIKLSTRGQENPIEMIRHSPLPLGVVSARKQEVAKTLEIFRRQKNG